MVSCAKYVVTVLVQWCGTIRSRLFDLEFLSCFGQAFCFDISPVFEGSDFPKSCCIFSCILRKEFSENFAERKNSLRNRGVKSKQAFCFGPLK